jgi:hypothetical protein
MTVALDVDRLRFMGPDSNQAVLPVNVTGNLVIIPEGAELTYCGIPPYSSDTAGTISTSSEMYEIVTAKTGINVNKRYKAMTKRGKQVKQAAFSIETYEIVGDNARGLAKHKSSRDKFGNPSTEMYEIVNEKPKALYGKHSRRPTTATEMYEIVNDRQVPSYKKRSKPATEMYEIVNDDASSIEQTISPLVTEYENASKLPNTRFAGNYAIEHMPVSYKHIWSGLTEAAKLIIADRGKIVANESHNLAFWSSIDFISLERSILLTDKKLNDAIASTEQDQTSATRARENAIRTNFLFGKNFKR